MEGIERKKIYSDIVTSWLGLFGVLGAIIFGVNEYLDTKRDALSDQKKNAFSLAESFASDEMLSIRTSINTVAMPVLEKSIELAEENAQTPKQAEIIARNYIDAEILVAIDKNNDSYGNVNTYISFFDRVWKCVELDICDKKAIVGLFKQNAYVANYLFQSYIKRVRLSNPDFANGINNILAEK